MKLLIIPILFCLVMYVYGGYLVFGCIKDTLDESSLYYKEDRPVFMATGAFILIWLLSPIIIPVIQIMLWWEDLFDKE